MTPKQIMAIGAIWTTLALGAIGLAYGVFAVVLGMIACMGFAVFSVGLQESNRG